MEQYSEGKRNHFSEKRSGGSERRTRKKYSFEKNIIGQSEAIKEVFKKISKAVKTNINVSITGETGTGKEVVAKTIHYNSDRKINHLSPSIWQQFRKNLLKVSFRA